MEDEFKLTGRGIIGKRVAICGLTANEYYIEKLRRRLNNQVSDVIKKRIVFGEQNVNMLELRQNGNWVFFDHCNWDDVKFKQYHVDTRDFYCSSIDEYADKRQTQIQLHTLLKYPERFVYSKDEVLKTLRRFFDESGGHNEWRFLALETEDEDAGNWLKYIRIYRIENTKTFIICNQYNRALKKIALASKVSIRNLNAH